MGFILYLLSIILSAFLLPIGLLYDFIKCFIRVQIGTAFKNLNNKFLKLATGIDIFGNVACEGLFNDLLITTDSNNKFGKYGQTISAVIGWNLKYNTLSGTGKILNKILDFFDKDHSLNSIKEDALLERRLDSYAKNMDLDNKYII